MTPSEPSEKTVKDLITNITTLSECLPASVPLASAEDKIYEVMTGEEGENTWHTFNRRFDAIFGQDCRDEQGRLHYLRRGQFGMGIVCKYLQNMDLATGDIPFDLMVMKLHRLNDEILYLQCVHFHDTLT
jgi:hypothetical protein